MGIWMTERERRRKFYLYIIIAALVSSITTSYVFYSVQMAYIDRVIGDLRINQTEIIANVSQEDLVTRIVDNVQASVVHVTVTKKTLDIFGREALVEATGSGFIITSDGYIATNNHVISGAEAAMVVLSDGREIEANIVGTDPMTDLAIIKIDRTGLTPAVLGDSDIVKPGQFVIAMGSPYKLEKTVTYGVVSALNRTLETEEGYEIGGAIQTDAAINPGNSGGPLIDMQGRVVGVNTAIISTTGGSQGIGFAIPINILDDISSELISNGKVTRAWLGITGMDMNKNLAKTFNISVEYGAVVVTVVSDGPADKAGLRGTILDQGRVVQFGDVIVEIAGKKVEGMNDLISRTNALESGMRVIVRFVRDGEWLQAPINLGERPENL